MLSLKRNESELEVNAKVLEAIISGMSEQLTKARQYLATKHEVRSVELAE